MKDIVSLVAIISEVMELLENLDVNGLKLSILKTTEGSSSREYKHYMGVFIRVANEACKKQQVRLYGTRYISVKKGILDMDYCEPGSFQYESFPPISLLNNSFVDFELQFAIDYECQEEGDRLELFLNNDYVLVQFIKGQWFVVEYSKRAGSKDVSFSIEHLESIEEKVGISLQNMSVKIQDEKCIKPYCEVLSYNDGPFFDFAIEVAVYNKNNEVIGFSQIQRDKDDFLGFEVFSFTQIFLDEPASEIGRVLFYPIKY